MRGKRPATAIQRALQRLLQPFSKHPLAAWLVLAACLGFTVFELVGYLHFLFPVLDLGLYNRHMWSIAHLDFSANPLKGYNLLGDHAHFILLLLAPLYALFPSPVTLLGIQALAISLSGWPIYLIARQHFSARIAALWLIPYYIYFGFWSALAYPFHVAPLTVLPMAWALYFLLQRRYVPLTITLLLLMLVKEDAPLVLVMVGLYLIILHRQYRLAAILAAIGAVYFAFVTKYWLPAVSGNPYGYSHTGLPSQPWLHPIEAIKAVLLPLAKPVSVFKMLMSFALLPLAGLEILILLAPLWLGRFLSTEPWRWTEGQHYSANQAPILAVAAIVAATRLLHIYQTRHQPSQLALSRTALVLPLACILGSVITWGTLNFTNMRLQRAWLRPGLSATERTAWQAVRAVPAGASVGVQSSFPQLTTRRDVYNLPVDFRKHQPEYLIMGESFDHWPIKSVAELRLYVAKAKAHGYTSVIERNGVYLLKRSR